MIVGKKKNKSARAYSSRFYRYFLSYVLLLILVLSILGVVVYRNFIATMRNEVKNANISAITQVKSVIDTRLREMERTALNISFNNNLKGYKVLNIGVDSLDAVRELKKYKSSNEFVYDIALFYNYNENDRIHTTLTSVDIDMFFDNIYRYEDYGSGEFLSRLTSLDTPTMYPVENVLLNRGEDKRFATYAYPLPTNTVKPYAIVIFFIEEETLTGILDNVLNEYDGYMYILDIEGNPITYLINHDTPPDTGERLLASSRSLSSGQLMEDVNIDNKNYSIAKITSDYNGWSYVMAMQTDQLMTKVNASRTIFNYVILSVLVLGVIIAFALANENYKPLKRLTELVTSQDKKLSNPVVSDEFDYVFEMIKDVSDENKSLSTQLMSRAGIMRNQIITQLLKDKSYDLDSGIDKTCGLELDLPYFVVMIFLIDDYNQFEADSEQNIKDLIIFSIINVIEELSEELGVGYGVELVNDRGVALLLNLKEEYIKERHISEFAFKTKEFFKQYFDFTLTVGIGTIYTDIEMIHESFLEANRAVYYRLIKGYDNVIFYEDIKDRHKRQYKYPVELEDELIMSIKQGKSQEIERITSEIAEYITKGSLSLEAVRCICFGIINTIMKTLNEMNIEPNSHFGDDRSILFAQPFETIDDLSMRIIDFCSAVCAYVEEQKESKNFELRDQLLELVEQNYTDSSLSLEGIASQFDMSPSYISRYFKDQMGDPIMQYVDMLRINHVKRLLKDTDIPLKDILPKVGYVDQSSFYRKFKRLEGITPMEYRKISQREFADQLHTLETQRNS